MLILPQAADMSPNLRSLASWKTESLTGIAGTVLTFGNVIDRNAALLFKNGSLVDPGTYTVTLNTITALSPASIVGDVWLLFYHFRSTT